MKVKKYKYLGNGKYKLFFNDNEYVLYEDIIIKYNILLLDNITLEEFNKFLVDNSYYEAYYKSLKYISRKLRTAKEIEKYLQKSNVNNQIILDVIKKLKEMGYLDERVYTKAYIYDQINLKNTGPEKIKKDLMLLGIDKKIVYDEIKEFNSDLIIEKLDKLIDKYLKSTVNNKSAYCIKNKIINKLINLGYKREDILPLLNNKAINDSTSYKKEYDKLYKKYSSKYSDKELEYFIKQKLYAKGFNYKE